MAGLAGMVLSLFRGAMFHWREMALILLALVVWASSEFRHSDNALLRRASSFGNRNDFSWRSRVFSWRGAFQMMGERPLNGFGWNLSEESFRNYYHDNSEQASAIQLNDYLTLGTTLGP